MRDLMTERCPVCTQQTLVYVYKDRAECRRCGATVYSASGHSESNLSEWEDDYANKPTTKPATNKL